MVIQGVSVGDILLLSHQAWKIGRAFTHGRSSAPAEFAEVASEANGLSDALQLVADTLQEEDSLASRAAPETREAINAIIQSAARTLSDLESLVKRYHVIRKRGETKDGSVEERSWREAVIVNYKTVKWTTEGGNINDLRDMLQMHTSTISLTMQALQSRSLARLERTVIPMAEDITSIHELVNGDLGNKIDDLHRIITGTPLLMARDGQRYEGSEHSRRVSGSTISTIEHSNGMGVPRILETQYSRTPSHMPTGQLGRSPHDSTQSEDTGFSSQSQKDGRKEGAIMDWEFETGGSSSSPKLYESIGSTLVDSPNSLASRSFLGHSTPRSSNRNSSLPRRESATLPNLFQKIDEDDAESSSCQSDAVRNHQHRSYGEDNSPISGARTGSRNSNSEQFTLPPPAISPISKQQPSPSTPSSLLGARSRSHEDSNTNANRQPSKGEKVAFTKSLFRNAVILCDVQGELIEYTQPRPDEPDPRYNTELVEACKRARICVIRKRENLEHGGTTVLTSIWALSEDDSVRCQQKLSESADTIPYCSYFQREKVSLADPAMALRFHGRKWGDMLEKEIKTNWINFVFTSEIDASAFQSAVFGRMLLGTFQTMKTNVIHSGIMGTFAFEEQFANIEMLRLWKTDGVSTPEREGGVFALLHLSSNFGEGWTRWWINNSRQQIRVSPDGAKHVKIKGMDITVVKPRKIPVAVDNNRRPSTNSVGPSLRRVTGVKIEFKTETEKARFVQTSRQVQENMLLLPEP